jgi:hypothetical protein
MCPLDDADRSRRHITPVGAAERRIRFQEVQLRPKVDVQETTALTSKGKGKQKGMEGQASPSVDRVTAPPSRAAVGSKGKRKGKQRQEIGNDNLAETGTGNTRDDDVHMVSLSGICSDWIANHEKVID